MPRSQARTSNLRTPRSVRRTVRIATAGLTAVAALTLTACGEDNPLKTSAAKPYHPAPRHATESAADTGDSTPGTGDAAEPAGTRPNGGGTAQVPAQGGGTDSGTNTAAGSGKHGATGTGKHGAGRRGSDTAVRHRACDADRIRIVAEPVKEPVNHLLLVATNTSGAACDLYEAPNLRFGTAQSPLTALPDSKPQAVVTLAPGQSGYAGVLTSSADGSGRNGRTMTSLSVSLAGRDGKGSVGGSAQVPLPGGSVYIDDSAWVTYWQSDMRDATAW
ncbi:hypothetical protein SSP35_03_02380 [Streptomyces sp. NBRC 110611]|uniref:DUF4232 domain-containing protein n=1 Tax=Streptomyces sp. NBRC 110611 TaxID=1621259 RepID=UPI00082DDB9A|nr:DUF4232 domain-containing protein [Streptomyces sp. NBRC 110611]GAU66590.1 hypothetical protein SSP35_03_02380 [Streptomyces sp. NBRC 110611]